MFVYLRNRSGTVPHRTLLHHLSVKRLLSPRHHASTEGKCIAHDRPYMENSPRNESINPSLYSHSTPCDHPTPPLSLELSNCLHRLQPTQHKPHPPLPITSFKSLHKQTNVPNVATGRDSTQQPYSIFRECLVSAQAPWPRVSAALAD